MAAQSDPLGPEHLLDDPAPADVLVVGGGIAGLMCALHLTERGLRPVVLERSPDGFGGRVCRHPDIAFTHAGRSFRFRSEHGMHAWWRQYRNFLAVLSRYGLTAALIDAFEQAVLFDDGKQVFRTNVGRETIVTPVPEPFQHVQLLRLPNIRGLIAARELPQFATLAARVFECIRFDPESAADRARYDALAVSDFLAGQPYFFRAFLRSLCRSAFFSEPEEVSLWAFLIALRLYVFLDRGDQQFAFAREPVMDAIFAPLMSHMRAAGARFHRGCAVVGLDPDPEGGYVAAVETPGGARHRVRARAAVLALDVPGAQALGAASPWLDCAYGDDLGRFTGRPSSVVRLFWGKAPQATLGESGVYSGKTVTDNYFWLHRFQDEFRTGWHEVTGGGVSESHIYAPLRLHDLPDEALIARAVRDIERGFPEVAGSLVHAARVRNPPTHINFPVGCATRFPRVETPRRDLALCGDWIEGGVPVLYMERACQTGIAAANHILAGRGLPTCEVLAPRPPKPHVRFLERALRLPPAARVEPLLTPPARRRRGPRLS